MLFDQQDRAQRRWLGRLQQEERGRDSFRNRKNGRPVTSAGVCPAEQGLEAQIRATMQACNERYLDLIIYDCCTENYMQNLNVVPDFGERGVT